MKQLIFEQIIKTYAHNKDNEVIALNKVSFSVKKGEMIAIVGESGSGKSTLLHIIGLLDDYDEGNYLFNSTNTIKMNENIKAIYRNTSIGFVLQQFGLINKRTAIENIIIPLLFSGYSIKKAKNVGLKKMKLLKIDSLVKRKVENLSGGQKQRVAIARAIVNDPKIILADEPTGALDSKTSEEIMKVLMKLNKKGMTIIIATHDPIVANLCTRKIVLKDGEIIDDIASV